MNRKGAVLFPILIVLIIISLALAAGSFYLYQKEHAQNIQLQGQITELEERQRATEGKLGEVKKIAAEFQIKLQETKAKLDSLTDEFVQEKSAHIGTLNQLEQYKTDLQQQKSLRQDLESKLQSAEDDGKKLKNQIKIIQQQKAELEEKIKNAEVGAGGVELGTVVVNEMVTAPGKGKAKPEPAKKAVSPQKKNLDGKVMVVNKEFNFVVINLGVKDSISVGDEFSVIHDGKIVGTVKIEKVHESMSAAGFAPELKDSIRENDRVSPKAK